MVGAADVVGTIDVVGVVGAGTMGAGIAQLALEAGHRVWIHDVDSAAIARGRARIRSGLERRAGRLDLDAGSAEAWIDARLGRLHEAATLQAIGGAGPDLIVEAALEDLEAKRTIFRAIDGLVPPDTILATNTSALSVADIAGATSRPMRVLGLHFFNPAPVMPLVEVVIGPATDPATADRARALMTLWGKVPVRCSDTPGFIVNRVNRPFTLEALAMLETGVGSVASIDEAIRSAGFPLGPFELMDLTGIDISLAAALGIFERSRAAGDRLADRFRPSPIQERLVAAGRLGRKTASGFYEYGPDGRTVGAATGLGLTGGHEAAAAGSPDAVVERITLAIVNEAYRAQDAGVATTADIDLALRLGAGHPIGPFERVEGLGGPAGVLDGLRRHTGDGPRFEPAPPLRALPSAM